MPREGKRPLFVVFVMARPGGLPPDGLLPGAFAPVAAVGLPPEAAGRGPHAGGRGEAPAVLRLHVTVRDRAGAWTPEYTSLLREMGKVP